MATDDDSRYPHSRACGIAMHDHGTACHTNCPTCHGRPWEPPADTEEPPVTDPAPEPSAPEPTPSADPGPGETTTAATRPLNSRSAYLPVLPDGWEYEVTLRGPGSTSIHIEAVDEAFEIRYHAEDEPLRTSNAENFREAAKIAGAGAKVMDRVHKADEEARKARDEALGVLGTERTPE